MEGKGNPGMGAPNLTDGDWLYGGTEAAIAEGLRHGRAAKMPAHGDLLGRDRVRMVAAYVYGLSHSAGD
jgi:cytochrome c oxidase cbb3-type subunit 3